MISPLEEKYIESSNTLSSVFEMSFFLLMAGVEGALWLPTQTPNIPVIHLDETLYVSFELKGNFWSLVSIGTKS